MFEFWDDYREWKLNNERLVDELLDKEAIYSQIGTILSK